MSRLCPGEDKKKGCGAPAMSAFKAPQGKNTVYYCVTCRDKLVERYLKPGNGFRMLPKR